MQGPLPPHPSQAQGGTREGGLEELIDRLAAGETPPADASVTTVPAPPGVRALVVGGTAWHVVAADVDPTWVATASLRSFLAAGYRPVGAGVLFGP